MLSFDIHLERSGFTLSVNEQLQLVDITGIMGPSGCGKTTLLRCLAGLEKIPGSSIQFRDVIWQRERQYLPADQRQVGYIFQDGRLFPHLNVRDNLTYGVKRRHPSSNHLTPDEVIDWLDIEALLARPVQSLSGGQRQRVAIGRALLRSPQLLMMDEPMAALDWAAKVRIIPRLRELNRRFHLPVLFVSHDREEMARLADDMLLMSNGQIADKGAVHWLLSQAQGLLADDHALSVLDGTVRKVGDYGVSELDVDGCEIVVDQDDLEPGQKVRVVVQAADISIALDDVQRISIQNRLRTTLEDIQELDDKHCLLQLRLKEQVLLALITQRARHKLALNTGMIVYAHFKAARLEVQ
ncbi:molybdenum ABC transporter ATP-binding protein [Parendozoicomonas haliclonae]|uniref:Spermidine/putrescine import ATP-binding protein PotA n=1 Tax=Parendozoicomonas haliclonae TaxID=1960125 RepID=A0A1X7AF42_9GAMM|nr:molybdenum ABC transporter ATP-binding protein [Parendozoicomonas haliclonae]SMA34682.1 Spermidine/putrescine import ATP-binding protein PotA [Parendozoicomonas haliclonae]